MDTKSRIEESATETNYGYIASNTVNVKSYVDHFGVIGTVGGINCGYMSKLLYTVILNKFRIDIDRKEYAHFYPYQEKVYNFVEDLRKLPTEDILIVLEYLDKVDHYLLDDIILQWCLPRPLSHLNRNNYHKTYKKNIEEYNHKLVNNITHYTIKNFCTDTLIKTNYVPVHCIDYLWYYMSNMDTIIEFSFINYQCSDYIGITLGNDSIELGFNMEFVLEMGLGKVCLSSKASFAKFLEVIVTNIGMVKKMLTCQTKDNYKKQLINISRDPSKYFGEHLKTLPSQVLDEIKEINSAISLPHLAP